MVKEIPKAILMLAALGLVVIVGGTIVAKVANSAKANTPGLS